MKIDLTPYIGGRYSVRRTGFAACEVACGAITEDVDRTSTLIREVIEDDRAAEPTAGYAIELCGDGGTPTRQIAIPAKPVYENRNGYIEQQRSGEMREIIVQQMNHNDALVQTLVRGFASMNNVMSQQLDRYAREVERLEAERRELLALVDKSGDGNDERMERLLKVVGPMLPMLMAPGPAEPPKGTN